VKLNESMDLLLIGCVMATGRSSTFCIVVSKRGPVETLPTNETADVEGISRLGNRHWIQRHLIRRCASSLAILFRGVILGGQCAREQTDAGMLGIRAALHGSGPS
jgi:hypothetical protein